MTNPSPTDLEEISALLAEAQAEAVKWNACCAALRAAILKYIKSNFTTATAGKAERELLEVGTLFYKDAGQNLLTHIAALEAELAQATRERDEWETQSENQCRDRERYRDVLVMLCAAPPEITRKAMASVAYDTVFNLIPKDVAEFQLVERSKAEAQLATRLPTLTEDEEALIDSVRTSTCFYRAGLDDVANPIDRLLSGAATPAPTAAHLRRFREQTEAEVFGYVTGVEDAAALYESVNPASDDERIKGSPGAGAMGAVIEYRDKIRELLHAKSPPQGAEE